MVLGLGVAAAVVPTYPGLLLLLGGGVAAVALGRPDMASVGGLLRIVAVLMGAAFLLNALFTPGVRLPGPSSSPVWFTEAGVREGLAAALRLASMACLAFSLVGTTSPRQLAEAVDSTLGKVSPFRGAGLAVNVACRFVPDFVQEAQRMRVIRSIRTPGRKSGIRSRIQGAGSTMLALIVIAVRRAERVADAMTARCYRSGSPRTAWRPGRFTIADGIALVIAAALCVSAVLLGAS
jgi:energy-coupling factor transport system permease protein